MCKNYLCLRPICDQKGTHYHGYNIQFKLHQKNQDSFSKTIIFTPNIAALAKCKIILIGGGDIVEDAAMKLGNKYGRNLCVFEKEANSYTSLDKSTHLVAGGRKFNLHKRISNNYLKHLKP